MSVSWETVLTQFSTALRDYVAKVDEAGLERANALGRQIVGYENAMLDLVMVYHQELATLTQLASTPEERDHTMALAQAFFGESLSSGRASLLEVIRQQNTALEVANRHKSEVLATMSHELRTPLNAIIGFSELMHDAKLGPVSDLHKEYLGDILSSARHLLQRINDILDPAKVEAGKIEPRPEEKDTL